MTSFGLVAAEASQPDMRTWHFQVSLDDRDIGTHTFEWQSFEGHKTLVSRASFDVRILFFNAYRYRHNSSERWQGNCLDNIESTTEAGRKAYRLQGATGAAGFQLETDAGASLIDADCVRTFAYWDPSMLKAQSLLNSQTGEYVSVELKPLEKVEFPFNGVTYDARRYELRGAEETIVLWYEESTGLWLGLETSTGEKTLRYQPLSLPEADPKTPQFAQR
jgi:hypothetical protein